MVELLMIIKIITVILFIVAVISGLQFWMGIHPPKHQDSALPSDFNLPYENVTFQTTDKKTIHAWFVTSPEPKGTVIVGHGYPFSKGNVLPLAKFLYPDYHLLFYDHRSFGQSSGAFTSVGVKEPKDVEAAVKYIRNGLGDEKPIFLFGFSLSASVMLMTNLSVSAIVADSPYANLEYMIKRLYRPFGPFKFPFVQFTNLYSLLFFHKHPKYVSPERNVKEVSTPILLIHGDQDSQIPVENAHRLKDADPTIRLWIVEGADHGQAHARHPKEYEKRVKEFLGQFTIKR